MYRKSVVISTKLAGGKTVQPTLILVISKFLTELLSRPGNLNTERICVRWFRGKLQQSVLITTWIWNYCKNLNIKYWSKLTAWKYWSCSGQSHADTTMLIMLIRIVLFLYPVLLSCFTLRLLVYKRQVDHLFQRSLKQVNYPYLLGTLPRKFS